MNRLGKLRAVLAGLFGRGKKEFENDPSEQEDDEIQYESTEERVAASDVSVEECIGWSDRAAVLRKTGEGDTCPEEGCDEELSTVSISVEDSAENFQSRTGSLQPPGLGLAKETGAAKGRAESGEKIFVHCPDGECANHMPRWKGIRAHKGDNIKHERSHGLPGEQDPYAGSTMDGVTDEEPLSEAPTEQPDMDKVLETAVDAPDDANRASPDQSARESANELDATDSDAASGTEVPDTDRDQSPTDAGTRESVDELDDDASTSEADDGPSTEAGDESASNSEVDADDTADGPDADRESVDDTLGAPDDGSPDADISEPDSPPVSDGGANPTG
jgi:hypothetical protein